MDTLSHNITLNINENTPKPIIIRPNTTISLDSFYRCYFNGRFIMNETNNRIPYIIVRDELTDLRYIKIVPGEYTGEQLASAIDCSLNDDTMEDEIHIWCCTYTTDYNLDPYFTGDILLFLDEW